MGFDLRKSKIFEDFGLINIEGITSFLANKAQLEQVIKPSGIDHLDTLMAGSIPPNPAELIASERSKQISLKF